MNSIWWQLTLATLLAGIVHFLLARTRIIGAFTEDDLFLYAAILLTIFAGILLFALFVRHPQKKFFWIVFSVGIIALLMLLFVLFNTCEGLSCIAGIIVIVILFFWIMFGIAALLVSYGTRRLSSKIIILLWILFYALVVDIIPRMIYY